MVSDKEVLGVIRDGFDRLCDYARTKWIQRAYGGDDAMFRANYERWREIESRGHELIAELGAKERGRK